MFSFLLGAPVYKVKKKKKIYIYIYIYISTFTGYEEGMGS